MTATVLWRSSVVSLGQQTPRQRLSVRTMLYHARSRSYRVKLACCHGPSRTFRGELHTLRLRLKIHSPFSVPLAPLPRPTSWINVIPLQQPARLRYSAGAIFHEASQPSLRRFPRISMLIASTSSIANSSSVSSSVSVSSCSSMSAEFAVFSCSAAWRLFQASRT